MIPPPPPRLAALAHQPGGLTAAEAAAAAQRRLEAMHADAVAGLDGMVARLTALGPRLADGLDPAALDEAYKLANAVFGVAGLFGLGALGEVAYSLCDLLDRLHASGGWHPAAVQVHLSGLALARQAGADAGPITEGLRRVVGSVTG